MSMKPTVFLLAHDGDSECSAQRSLFLSYRTHYHNVNTDASFDENHPPSCSSNGDEVDETLDVQDACWRLSYLVSGIEFNLSQHELALPDFDYDEESCDDYRQAYHLSSSVEEIRLG